MSVKIAGLMTMKIDILLVAGHPGVADGEQRQRRLFVRQYHIPKATDPLDLQVCWKSALVEHPPGGLRVQTILAAPVGESDTFTYDHREYYTYAATVAKARATELGQAISYRFKRDGKLGFTLFKPRRQANL